MKHGEDQRRTPEIAEDESRSSQKYRAEVSDRRPKVS